MIRKPYRGIQIAPEDPTHLRRRYSVTSDVVAFRRCPRQYGAFRVHNYAPAHQTQIYYGTIVHQVLDRCHQHYHGLLDPAMRGRLPDDGAVVARAEIEQWFEVDAGARRQGQDRPDPPSEILRYFVDVEDGLRSRGIHPVSPDPRVKAAVTLQI